MLQVDIPETEFYDERDQQFKTVKCCSLKLEHSLVSISKWEMKWRKPFLSRENKSQEEFLDYIRCMTVNQNVDPAVYQAIPSSDIRRIADYIGDTPTATWFNNRHDKPSREIVTSEVIYYMMVSYQIPFECQKWHLGRLLTLIRICDIKNSPKKMSKRDVLAQNRALNAARRKQSGSSG